MKEREAFGGGLMPAETARPSLGSAQCPPDELRSPLATEESRLIAQAKHSINMALGWAATIADRYECNSHTQKKTAALIAREIRALQSPEAGHRDASFAATVAALETENAQHINAIECLRVERDEAYAQLSLVKDAVADCEALTTRLQSAEAEWVKCEDCPPADYPTNVTRCWNCPLGKRL